MNPNDLARLFWIQALLCGIVFAGSEKLSIVGDAQASMCTGEVSKLDIFLAGNSTDGLVINKILHNAGCNCIEVEDITPLLNNEKPKFKVKLKIDTTGKKKDFNVLFQAVTDSNETIPIGGKLVVKITKDVHLSNTFFDSGQCLKGEFIKHRLEVSIDGQDHVTQISVLPTKKNVHCHVSDDKRGRTTKTDIGEYNYIVVTKAPSGIGAFDLPFHVIISFADKRVRRFKFVVSGTVVPQISIKPNRLFLGLVKVDTVICKDVIIEGQTKELFRVISIQCKDGLKLGNYQVEEISGSKKRVELHLTPIQRENRGVVKSSLSFVLNLGEGKESTISLPCLYIPKKHPSG